MSHPHSAIFFILLLLSLTTYGHESTTRRFITAKDIVTRGTRSCVASPEETEGPYYVENMPYRKNITEGRPGVPMALTITLLDLETCLPYTMSSVTVEIWHCDHAGIYSHFEEASKNVKNPKTDTKTYLRGKTLTNQTTGVAVFDTIVPGWYTGRADHIHTRIWKDSTLLLTSQFSFADAFFNKLATIEPYTQNTNQKTYISTDMVFSDNGVLGMLSIEQVSSNLADGVTASITMGIDFTGSSSSGGSGSSILKNGLLSSSSTGLLIVLAAVAIVFGLLAASIAVFVLWRRRKSVSQLQNNYDRQVDETPVEISNQ